jgi:hypothetical protein
MPAQYANLKFHNLNIVPYIKLHINVYIVYLNINYLNINSVGVHVQFINTTVTQYASDFHTKALPVTLCKLDIL